MSQPSDPLRRLGDSIDRARSGENFGSAAGASDTGTGSALGFGMRVGIEMLASLLVGLAIGWLFDRFLGTRPWGLIAFFFVGAAAGVLNVYRASQGLGRRAGGI